MGAVKVMMMMMNDDEGGAKRWIKVSLFVSATGWCQVDAVHWTIRTWYDWLLIVDRDGSGVDGGRGCGYQKIHLIHIKAPLALFIGASSGDWSPTLEKCDVQQRVRGNPILDEMVMLNWTLPHHAKSRFEFHPDTLLKRHRQSISGVIHPVTWIRWGVIEGDIGLQP